MKKRPTIEDIIEKAVHLDEEQKEFVKKSYRFAKKSHKGQKRKTGEAYIYHPIHVAYYIAHLGLDHYTIAAALLHDTIEDCGVQKADIKNRFGKTVLKLVNGVTNLRHTSEKQKLTDDTIENLRRFLLVAAKDIRVLLIKLSDRLHNAQTIEGLPKKRQKSYAREIKLIYSALADYLGIYYFKKEFDNIAFEILNPEEFNEINNYLKKNHKKRAKYLEEVKKIIKDLLSKNNLSVNISGRDKSIYSIHKKLEKYLRQGKIHSKNEFGRIYDYYGFRIIVDSVEDCYKVLGIIHTKWHPLTSEFDDYIANPKPNGYKSLQTTVFCKNRKLVEIQIQTKEMYEYNQFGPASHISYKKNEQTSSRALGWLRRINIFGQSPNIKPIKRNYKIQVFKENIFVLTPKNEVKKLPKGSTPVDFAYTIHTEVGNKCRGARVNDKLVSLDHELKTGDQIEIIVKKQEQFPLAKWLSFVAASSTRSKIKQALRKKEEQEAIENGRNKLNQELKRSNKNPIEKIYAHQQNKLDIFIYKNNARNLDGLLARIGFGLISPQKIVNFIYPKENQKRSRSKRRFDIAIEDSTQTQYTKAKCCKPKYPDSIVALNTISRGIRIHKKDCPHLKKHKREKYLRATWL